MPTCADITAVTIPCVNDPRGDLAFIQHPGALPFAIGGVEWLCADAPGPMSALRVDGPVMLVALIGRVEATVDSGTADDGRFTLQAANSAIIVEKDCNVALTALSERAVVLALTSGARNEREAPATGAPDAHATSNLDCVRLVDLPRHYSGNALRVRVDNGPRPTLPFDVERVFYLFNVPAGSMRGGHSHFRGQEIITAVSGRCDVTLDDGVTRRTWRLDSPDRGLYVPCGLWRTIDKFSPDTICLVLTSITFDEADYVRNFDDFLRLTSNKRNGR